MDKDIAMALIGGLFLALQGLSVLYVRSIHDKIMDTKGLIDSVKKDIDGICNRNKKDHDDLWNRIYHHGHTCCTDKEPKVFTTGA